MTDQASASTSGAASVAPSALRMSRGVTVTWWYTLSGVMGFNLSLVLFWSLMLVGWGKPLGEVLIVGIGGLVWTASTLPLLFDYRHRDESTATLRRRVIVPVLVAVVYGIAAGLVSGSWLVGAVPIVQSLVLLSWQRGVRLRFVAASTILLFCLWLIDMGVPFTATGDAADMAGIWTLGLYSVFVPFLTVLSLWWWDVLIMLDRARISEARLGATQERLRVATDVHDLQGHHLQVIALQLELTEKLLSRGDPEAAVEQLRLARTSVDEARQGTRDLATRFRSVSLGDELANARDLLRAAGISADASIGPDADAAPADVLGPVIRETTTNVLRHGGGRRAHLTLTRTPDSTWRYEITNDVAPNAVRSDDGAGLAGIERRAAEAGGTLDVGQDGDEFAVVVTIPARGVA
ncbi:sensor histidine kinase [Microbacterium sp. SSM24]|uniref:sensor histidine kinase n=1 Tax=Microbacterium sp. SSM24 TaxID=2991714 RepID=UPI002227119E|nr:histidine kinase [Microbacterium sp. SSM24]MCW3493879.1 histidine kinase [Microbacterium sp. SSM24]